MIHSQKTAVELLPQLIHEIYITFHTLVKAHHQSTPLTESEAANSTDVIYAGTSSDNWINTSTDNISSVFSTVNMDDLSSVKDLDVAISVDVSEDSVTITFFTGHMSETEF